jgi:biopolymer transport protein ExbB
VGNNAPFVGLLGTVIGVVGALQGLADTTVVPSAAELAPEHVLGAIAEALVATAVGLVVAIPAVAAFNAFHGLLTSTLANADTLGHVVLSHLDTSGDET